MQTKPLALCATLLIAILLVAGCTSNDNTNNQNNTNGGNNTDGGNHTASLTEILNRANNVTSMYYDMTITMPEMPGYETGVLAHVWQKQGNMKTKMNLSFSGMSMTMISIKRPNGTTYTWTSITNQWQTGESGTAATTPPNATDMLKYNLTQVGTETIDGKVCTVVEYTTVTDQGSVNVRVWIWNDHGLPIKMVSTATVAGKEVTTTMTMTNFSFATIPDSTFDLVAP